MTPTPPTPTPPTTLRTLMTDLIDYAGLFPPAKLDMAAAVETYNRCKMGEHEWMLGRFICPVSRLAEFTKAASPLLPGTFAGSGYRTQVDSVEPWRLSALVDSDLITCLDDIDAFNEHHNRRENGLCAIDMLEMKISDPNHIDESLDEIPDDLFPFFEFPLTTDCRGFVAALAGNGAGAKIRTGGVAANAFPTVAEISAFLHACAAAEVPFKATAGLHHPVRGVHRLTYEKDSPTCRMHGFLNLFIAAAICRSQRPDEAATQAILEDDDPTLFRFSDQVAGWKEHLLAATDLARVREAFALSFGSCSFDEPIEDLRTLGLL